MRDKLIELIKEADSIAAQGIKEGKLHTDGQLWAVFGDYLIANGVTVQEWISVEDRLPETYDKEPDWSVTVLFRTTQGHIHSGYRNIGRPQTSFYDDAWTPPYWLDESENLTFEEDEVTHWMPLPQAPKGE